MKRRTFMSMFGAAAVAPALPAAAAQPPAALMKLAAAHAKKYPFVSLIGLSKRVGVSQAEAEGLLTTLSRQGLIGEVQKAGRRPVFAASKVFVPSDASLIKAAQAQRKRQAAQREAKRLAREAKREGFHVDISAMMAHLRDLCVTRGLPIARVSA